MTTEDLGALEIKPDAWHDSFIKFGDTLDIIKCLEHDCLPCNGQGQFYHCPHCVSSASFAREVDVLIHLDLQHWPTGVQFKDLLIISCSQTCSETLETTGHYHCPLCPALVEGQSHFLAHLQQHLKEKNEDVEFAYIPDTEHPASMVYQDCTITLCVRSCGVVSEQGHYHCPACNNIEMNRNKMIGHLRLCILLYRPIPQKHQILPHGMINLPLNPREEFPMWHKSIVRTLYDIPIRCCGAHKTCKKHFHCPLCVAVRGKPWKTKAVREHLRSHVRQSISYKGYTYLPCNLECGNYVTNKFHFHCGYCGLTERDKRLFKLHLKLCQASFRPPSLTWTSSTPIETHNPLSNPLKPAANQIASNSRGRKYFANKTQETISPDDKDNICDIDYKRQPEIADHMNLIPDLQMFNSISATFSRTFVNAFDFSSREEAEKLFTKAVGASSVLFLSSPGIDSTPVFSIQGSLEGVLQSEKALYKELKVKNGTHADLFSKPFLSDCKKSTNQKTVGTSVCLPSDAPPVLNNTRPMSDQCMTSNSNMQHAIQDPGKAKSLSVPNQLKTILPKKLDPRKGPVKITQATPFPLIYTPATLSGNQNSENYKLSKRGLESIDSNDSVQSSKLITDPGCSSSSRNLNKETVKLFQPNAGTSNLSIDSTAEAKAATLLRTPVIGGVLETSSANQKGGDQNNTVSFIWNPKTQSFSPNYEKIAMKSSAHSIAKSSAKDELFSKTNSAKELTCVNVDTNKTKLLDCVLTKKPEQVKALVELTTVASEQSMDTNKDIEMVNLTESSDDEQQLVIEEIKEAETTEHKEEIKKAKTGEHKEEIKKAETGKPTETSCVPRDPEKHLMNFAISQKGRKQIPKLGELQPVNKSLIIQTKLTEKLSADRNEEDGKNLGESAKCSPGVQTRGRKRLSDTQEQSTGYKKILLSQKVKTRSHTVSENTCSTNSKETFEAEKRSAFKKLTPGINCSEILSQTANITSVPNILTKKVECPARVIKTRSPTKTANKPIVVNLEDNLGTALVYKPSVIRAEPKVKESAMNLPTEIKEPNRKQAMNVMFQSSIDRENFLSLLKPFKTPSELSKTPNSTPTKQTVSSKTNKSITSATSEFTTSNVSVISSTNDTSAIHDTSFDTMTGPSPVKPPGTLAASGLPSTAMPLGPKVTLVEAPKTLTTAQLVSVLFPLQKVGSAVSGTSTEPTRKPSDKCSGGIPNTAITLTSTLPNSYLLSGQKVTSEIHGTSTDTITGPSSLKLSKTVAPSLPITALLPGQNVTSVGIPEASKTVTTPHLVPLLFPVQRVSSAVPGTSTESSTKPSGNCSWGITKAAVTPPQSNSNLLLGQKGNFVGIPEASKTWTTPQPNSNVLHGPKVTSVIHGTSAETITGPSSLKLSKSLAPSLPITAMVPGQNVTSVGIEEASKTWSTPQPNSNVLPGQKCTSVIHGTSAETITLPPSLKLSKTLALPITVTCMLPGQKGNSAVDSSTRTIMESSSDKPSAEMAESAKMSTTSTSQIISAVSPEQKLSAAVCDIPSETTKGTSLGKPSAGMLAAPKASTTSTLQPFPKTTTWTLSMRPSGRFTAASPKSTASRALHGEPRGKIVPAGNETLFETITGPSSTTSSIKLPKTLTTSIPIPILPSQKAADPTTALRHASALFPGGKFLILSTPDNKVNAKQLLNTPIGWLSKPTAPSTPKMPFPSKPTNSTCVNPGTDSISTAGDVSAAPSVSTADQLNNSMRPIPSAPKTFMVSITGEHTELPQSATYHSVKTQSSFPSTSKKLSTHQYTPIATKTAPRKKEPALNLPDFLKKRSCFIPSIQVNQPFADLDVVVDRHGIWERALRNHGLYDDFAKSINIHRGKLTDYDVIDVPEDEQYFNKHPVKSELELLIKEKGKDVLKSFLKNKDSSNLTCSICSEQFPLPGYVLTHMMTVHVKYKCPECSSIFTTRQSLARHRRSDHHSLGEPQENKSEPMTGIRCGECSEVFDTRKLLDAHQLSKHDYKRQCLLCSPEKVIDVNDKTYACDKLLVHIENIHFHNENKIPCETCGKLYRAKNLTSHSKRHKSDLVLYQCPICGKTVKDKNTFIIHEETHKPLEERTFFYTCEYCGKGFRNKTSFKDHVNSKHTGEKNYECKECGKKFVSTAKYSKHKYTKHVIRQFKCEICERPFKFKLGLREHMFVHTRISKHVCPMCERHCASNAVLKSHMARCEKNGGRGTWHMDTWQPARKKKDNESSSIPSKGIKQKILPKVACVVEETEVADCVDEDSGSAEDYEYMCSECNTSFPDLNSAESHVQYCILTQQ